MGVIQYDGMQRREINRKSGGLHEISTMYQDIHNGAVKQIVGGSLKDAGNAAVENYISRQDADYYATMCQKAWTYRRTHYFAESAGVGIL